MTTTTARLQTHASIDTADLTASVSFYRALLGAEPALERHDYARFDVTEPPLVLGLTAVAGPAAGSTGALEHLGVRFEDEADLDGARRRLEGLAVPIEKEEPDTGARSRVQRARARLRRALEACCRFAFDARGNLTQAIRRPGSACDCDGS